jgi:hypothetical protein
MSPLDQCLTLRLVRGTHSIIDSQGFVDCRVLRSAPPAEAGDGERLLEALTQRRGGAGVAAVELGGQCPEALERRRGHPAPTRRAACA